MGGNRKTVAVVSLLALCATVPVAGQLEAMDAGDSFKFLHNNDDHNEPTESRTSFHPGALGTERPPIISNSSNNASAPRKRNASLLQGFGSDCSPERRCNALLGLACISHNNQSSRCACAPSSPIPVTTAGVQKCVRAKGLLEACVSHQECSFNNPNVQCIDSRCNCSRPFTLTPARLCQLPLTEGGDVLGVALSVMFALALLVLAGGYAYQKRVRERDGSGNNWMPDRSRYTESSSTSSRTHMLDKGGGPFGHRDDDDGSRPEGVGDERMRARLSQPALHQQDPLPRHPPRYISHKAANLKELDSGREHHKRGSGGMKLPRGSSVQRMRKGRHVTGQKTRKTDAALGRTEQEFSSSFPVHLMKPKDEHMRKILVDEQKVVVTVEADRGRGGPEEQAQSPPPVMFLRRHEAPPAESTDDSFMKELKLRCMRKAHRMGDLTDTVSTTSAEPPPPPPAVHAGHQHKALQTAPPPQATAVVDEQKQPGTGQPSAGAAPSNGVPPKKHDADIKPMQHEQYHTKAVGKDLDTDKKPQVGQKLLARFGIFKPPTDQNERARVDKRPELSFATKAALDTDEKPLVGQKLVAQFGNFKPPKDQNERAIPDQWQELPFAATTCNITRRASSPPAIFTTCEADAQAPGSVAKARPHRPSQSERHIAGNSVRNSTVPAEATENKCLEGYTKNEGVRRSPSPHCMDTAAQPGSSRTSTRTKETSNRPPEKAVKGVELDVGPIETSCGGDTSLKFKAGLGVTGARKQQVDDADYMGIEEVGKLARLLSGLIRKHEMKSSFSSGQDATISESDPLEAVPKFRSGFATALVGPTSTSPSRKNAKGAFESDTDSIKTSIMHQDVKNRLPLPPSKELPERHRKTLQHTEQGAARTSAFMHNTNAQRPFGLQSGMTSFSPLPDKCGAGQEAAWNPWDQIGGDVRGERKPVAFVSTAGRPAVLHILSTNNADQAQTCTIRVKGSSPEPTPAGSPQGYPNRAVAPQPGYAAQTAFEKQGSAKRVVIEKITEHDEDSLPSSGAGGQAFANSTASETTQSPSTQDRFQQYMTGRIGRPTKFVERPFADVLASLESEMTSSLREDHRKEVKEDNGNAIGKAPVSSTRRSSGQPCTDVRSLDAASIQRPSKEANERDLAQAVRSKQDGDASSSLKHDAAAAAAAPSKKIVRSDRHATATTVDSGEGSTEAPRAQMAFCGSDEGPMPPSLSFVSSTGSLMPPLSDLPRLDQSTKPSTGETEGSMTFSVQVDRTFSIATQTESSNPTSSVRSEPHAHAQLLPTPPGFLPKLKKVRNRDVGPRVNTDHPCTEDIKKVVMLGNKYYLEQRARKRPASRSASTLDETQYVLSQIEDPADRPPSRLALLGPGSKFDEMSPCSHESMPDALIQCSTLSSEQDIDEPKAAANYEPLKLRDLVMLQHPDVDLKNIVLVELSKRRGAPALRSLSGKSSEEDRKQQKGTAVAEPKDTVARDYKAHQKSYTVVRDFEPMLLEKAELARSEGTCQTTVPQQKQSGKSSKDAAHRSSIIKPLLKIGSLERRSDHEAVSSRRAAAVFEAAETTAIRFIGSLSSQNFSIMPDRAVPVGLQSDKGVDVPPRRQLIGAHMRPSKLMTLSESRNRQILLSRALEEPSFESIYNAILQSSQVTAPGLNVPKHVPCSPERPAASSRSVCFDDSLTVVTIEPPPGQPTKSDPTEAESMPPSLWLQQKRRRRSSVRRSSSGSPRPQAPATWADAASCEASKIMRWTGRRRSAFHEYGTRHDTPAEAGGGGSETRVGGRVSRRKSSSPLMSSFFSFEDTGSELAFLPYSNNFDCNDSSLASQRHDSRHEGPNGGEKSTSPNRSAARPR
ncbi:uncharacterized protein LOC144173801 [Haemaphysalis longicornis]